MLNFLSSKRRIKKITEKNLEKYSRPSVDFFTLIVLSSSLAAIGLALNNIAIIIGAMVVAPLVTPIFGFSLNLILAKGRGIGKTLFSIFTGTILGILTAFFMGHIINIIQGENFITTTEILSRTHPDLLYFIVAILSGSAGAYAYARPQLSEKIVGIAISTAIIPPIAVIGLGISIQNWDITQASLILYLLNLLGICFGSILMFLILGFGKKEELEIK